jgi:alpha-beta hydrolase superfamily lysophospholipase
MGDDLPSLTRRQILNRDRSTVKARRMPRFRRHWRGYDEGMKADVMGVFDIAGKTGEIARSAGSQLARGTGSQLAARTPRLAMTTGAHLAMLSTPRKHVPWSDEFYAPPKRLKPLAPGALIRCEPMDAYVMPGVRLRARAWRMLYRSTGAVGEPTAVSGTLLLPEGFRRRRPLPLIGYAIGTHGLSDDSAPSRLLSLGRDWEAGLIALVLARGFAVAQTDYQGLGTPGDHAFMVGRALGNNVLDVVRAARQLTDAEALTDAVPSDGPLALMGYSEGGAAAGWAAQLHPSYAPELDIAGVAAGAAAADVEAATPALDGSLFAFFLTYGAIGFAAAYPDLELEKHLTEDGSAAIAILRNTSIFQAAMRGPRYARIEQLSDPNVMELPEWRARLGENRLGSIAPAVPMLLHHARHDQIVAFEQSQKLFEQWSALGVPTTLHVTRGGIDHLSGGVAGAPIALDWLSRLFANPRQAAGGGNVVPLRPRRAA